MMDPILQDHLELHHFALETILEMTLSIHSQKESRPVAREVLFTAMGLCGCSRGALYVPPREGAGGWLRLACAESSPVEPAFLDEDLSLVPAHLRRAGRVGDLLTKLQGTACGKNVMSLLKSYSGGYCVPLIAQDATEGVLLLGESHTQSLQGDAGVDMVGHAGLPGGDGVEDSPCP